MAVNEPRVVFPKLLAAIDLDEAVFYLDREIETLIVFFHGASARPIVNVPVSDFEYLRVDAETEEVTGIMVEAFFRHALYQNPLYLHFAALAGAGAEEIAALREQTEAWFQHLSPERQRRQALSSWLSAARIGQQLARHTA